MTRVVLLLFLLSLFVLIQSNGVLTKETAYICDNVYFEDPPAGDIKCRQTTSTDLHPKDTIAPVNSIPLFMFSVLFFIAPGHTVLLGLCLVPVVLIFHAIKPLFL